MKVSVLTPAYNVENYIKDTIDGILFQSFSDFEFIILDDNSKDNTFKIAKEYEAKDSRVKVFQNEDNLGIAGNRNKLISLASGEYIAWQDADDVSFYDRLEKQVKILDEDNSVGIVGGGLQFFNDKVGDFSKRLYAAKDKELRNKIFRYSPVAQPSAMIRKSVFEKVGLYDLKMPPAEDLDMSFRIGKYFKFANVADVVVRYREHDKSATFTRLRTIEKNTIAMRFRYAKDGYTMTTADKIYNYTQRVSMYVIPTKIKIWLFNKIRNK